ncbi:MAG TPA: pitrilysin family protein [Pyrinomonadaceae bacterium]|nr:pitrilysin family protein [Pyrinomonadaceae bacterium]
MKFPAKFGVAVLSLMLAFYPAFSQTPTSQPEREQLLNGLQLLLWQKPGSPDVILKLRINSGAAFDLAGKSGQMALLGDLLFPDPATIEFFTSEMGGKLDVSVNYDSITITMVGKVAEFEQIVGVLRNALLATQLTPETVARMRDERIKSLRDLSIAPATVADRAIAARLFREFPYGRPAAGSPEDLARVDRADLMLARERFLNSNNATLAIVGGVSKARAMKSLRQLLGPWRKSEQIVPTTFRQPNPPDAKTLIVNVPGPTVEVRLAARGVSRSNTDFHVATVLARLAQHRWQGMTPELAKQPVFARSDAYVLPGAFVMGAAVNSENAVDALASARKVIDSLMNTPATAEELERAKTEVINEVATALSKPEALPDAWLDADTYNLKDPQDQITLLRSVTASDIQRLANRLFKTGAIASVVAGETEPLKAALNGRVQYEVLGEMTTPVPSPKPPVKPASNINPR